MALPDIQKAKATRTLEKFCHDRVPPHVRGKLKLEFEISGQYITLLEVRPVWNDPSRHTRSGVVKFRWVTKDMKWSLYWRDRNLKWHFYEEIEPTPDFDLLIKEVDRDPTGIFWG